ncbi:MAG: FecR domain-containing protein [Pedobacter sp.]|uniref:FecR family protein n=1 Tax=Pedobacter sp. TaxID=1411316 RepID=UPI0035656AF5
MENIKEIKATLNKYINNELDEEQARAFLEYVQSGSDQEAMLLLIQEFMDGPQTQNLLDKPELLTLLNQSFTKITDSIDTKPKKSSIRLWSGIAAGIAAVVALMILGVYFFNHNNAEPNDKFDLVQSVTPGKIGATLTLANGRKINLSEAGDGEIAKEEGISVIKTAEGELIYEILDKAGDLNKENTLTTAKGETYILILPDKSKVWMNAASSLTYNTNLNKGIRQVKLQGEAYFQIAEDKSRPFIVETREQKVQVLGTHFNVNAYSDEEKVTTTLLKGSVKVSGKSGTEVLKPGEQSSVTEGSISITKVDTERAIAWKNNKFLFENDDIRYIMRMIERWYDVDVVYTGEMPTEKFGGGVSRFDNVTQVLNILESTGGVRFKVEGRKIFVSK